MTKQALHFLFVICLAAGSAMASTITFMGTPIDLSDGINEADFTVNGISGNLVFFPYLDGATPYGTATANANNTVTGQVSSGHQVTVDQPYGTGFLEFSFTSTSPFVFSGAFTLSDSMDATVASFDPLASGSIGTAMQTYLDGVQLLSYPANSVSGIYGNSFSIDSASGFHQVDLVFTPNNLNFTLSSLAVSDLAVPEPGTVFLMLGGCLALISARKLKLLGS
jgi:hypothetical protein